MIDINELRRLAQAATPHVGHACKYQEAHWLREGHVDFENADLFIASERPQEDAAFYAASNPSAVIELLDRLEAAEKSDAESIAMYRKARDERDALRAKIAEMERQEPVAWLHETRRDSDVVTDAVKHVWGKSVVGALAAYSIPLYALPGAQPAPIEQGTSVRKAWARFSNELHRSSDAPYPGMAEAFEQHFSQSFTDRDWRAESGTWAAAWKAAKNHGAHPAPSVPEDVMRDAERYRYLRARDDETAGIGCWIEAEGRACDRGWLYGVQLDSAIDSFIEMLAAAPEAKPCP